jgi:hypothetical protein
LPGALRLAPPVKLDGTMRLRGKLTDSGSAPLGGILCVLEPRVTPAGVRAVSQADGTFDCGRTASSAATLTVQPKQPVMEGANIPGNNQGTHFRVKAGDTIPTVYVPVTMNVPKEQTTKDLSIQLERAEVLVLTGVVEDAAGKAVAGANVWMMTNDATLENYRAERTPKTVTLTDRIEIREQPKVTSLGVAKAGPDGRWAICLTASHGVYIETYGTYPVNERIRVEAFAVGAHTADGREALVRDLKFDTKTGQATATLRLERSK